MGRHREALPHVLSGHAKSGLFMPHRTFTHGLPAF